MNYMTVPRIGSGTQDDPYRPDIPEDISFVGQDDPESGTYLVAVPKTATVGVKAARTTLSTRKQRADAIQARGLRPENVDTWKVG